MFLTRAVIHQNEQSFASDALDGDGSRSWRLNEVCSLNQPFIDDRIYLRRYVIREVFGFAGRRLRAMFDDFVPARYPEILVDFANT